MASSTSKNFPPPPVLKEAITNQFRVPVVFKNAWPSWRYEDLTNHYGNVVLDFRVVPKALKDISWEGTANYVEASINQFLEWQTGINSHSTNPFQEFNAEEFWAYSSYNYVNEIFATNNTLKIVDWSTFGFSEVSPKDSAFWIGSEGSYTPCHFDTYGFNLVAQIYGRKKWTLFPPEDTSFMYPTRIPYEESSVFSAVNILGPDLQIHPHFKFSHPHVITLEPGDVLFVPHNWWHFVQNLDITVSVNSWIDLDLINDSHLEESVTRAMMSSFISFFEPNGESWLNPKEALVSPEETLMYISSELSKIKETKQKPGENDGSDSSIMKSIKVFPESDVHSVNCNLKYIHHENIQYVKPQLFSECFGQDVIVCEDSRLNKTDIKHIMNCFVHPEVISVICRLLKE